MELIYNGTEITELVNIEKAEVDTYLGDRADTILIMIERDETVDKWGFAPGDTIQIKEDELNTGIMTVNKVRFIGHAISITASSIPEQTEVKKKKWSSIGFKDLVKELCKNIGMAVEFFGVDDQIYNEVTQDYVDDLTFLGERCALEGCSLMAYNGKIKVAAEKWIEEQAASSVEVESDGEQINDDVQLYGECTVTDKNIKGTYTENGKLPKMTVVRDYPLSSIDEARRFAKNLMQKKNLDKKTWVIYHPDSLLTELSAGSIIKVTCGTIINKPAILSHVRHSLMNETTKIWFRLPI